MGFKGSIIDRHKHSENIEEILINKLTYDEEEFIYFLMTSDEFDFRYVLSFLDEIILQMYSEKFIKKLKDIVFKRYNELSNINIDNVKTYYKKYND